MMRIIQLPAISKNVARRFWSKIQKGSHDACWPYTGTLTTSRHGRFKIAGVSYSPHRISWQLANGPIPVGLYICHRCDNPPCCNPRHLVAETARWNAMDAVRKGRMTHPIMTESRRRALCGESSATAVYTEIQILEMHRLHNQDGLSGYAIAKRLGKHKGHIYDILKWRYWGHLKAKAAGAA